jgi:hypothetical protein
MMLTSEHFVDAHVTRAIGAAIAAMFDRTPRGATRIITSVEHNVLRTRAAGARDSQRDMRSGEAFGQMTVLPSLRSKRLAISFREEGEC